MVQSASAPKDTKDTAPDLEECLAVTAATCEELSRHIEASTLRLEAIHSMLKARCQPSSLRRSDRVLLSTVIVMIVTDLAVRLWKR